MAQTTAQHIPLSCATTIENVHYIFVRRECRVFAVPEPIQKQWIGLKTFVVVQREGLRDGQPFDEYQFYICSQSLSTGQLRADTQGHWGIENRLHWVNDVTLAEDFPPRTSGNAPVNWAILHSFFITIAPSLGFRTIPQAQRALATNSPKFFLSLYETTLIRKDFAGALIWLGEVFTLFCFKLLPRNEFGHFYPTVIW